MTLASRILDGRSELSPITVDTLRSFGSYNSGIYSYERRPLGIIRINRITRNMRLYNLDGSLNTKNWKE